MSALIAETMAYSWRDVPPGTALAAVVAPYRHIGDDDVALAGHLLGDGTVQLFNPGFDASLVGVATLPWFGYGHCALLAAAVHHQSGQPLTSLIADTGKAAHTAVTTSNGLLDWRGVEDPGETQAEYEQLAGATMAWHAQSFGDWKQLWLPAGEALGEVYDQFSLALSDFLAHQLTRTECAPSCPHLNWLSTLTI